MARDAVRKLCRLEEIAETQATTMPNYKFSDLLHFSQKLG